MVSVMTVLTVVLILTKSHVSAQGEEGTAEFCKNEAFKQGAWRQTLKEHLLPGVGWDNLASTGKARIFKVKYFQCFTSTDFRFFVPDSMEMPKFMDVRATVDILTSPIKPYSTSNAWMNRYDFIIKDNSVSSGAYSREFLKYKQRMIHNWELPIISELNVQTYAIRFRGPGSFKLTDDFVDRVGNIMNFLSNYQAAEALFEAELLIKKFGTHVITEVKTGKGIKEAIYVKRDFLRSSLSSERARSNLRFEMLTDLLLGAAQGAWHRQVAAAERILGPNSILRSDGMTLLDGSQFFERNAKNLSEWKKDDSTKLLVLTRMGMPLYRLFTTGYIEMVSHPRSRLIAAQRIVRHTIETYYKLNTHPGCSDMNSPSFSPLANFDDGSCTTNASNRLFGGVFKTCRVSGVPEEQEEELSHACVNKSEVHADTSDFSCPDGYKQVELFTVTTRLIKGQNGEIYDNPTESGNSELEGQRFLVRESYFWCFAYKNVVNDSGFMFGGIFGERLQNLYTGTRSCPEHFQNHFLLPGYTVCLTKNRAWAMEKGRFGGFFSCDIGNPYAAEEAASLLSDRLKRDNAGNKPWYQSKELWPKRCPRGFNARPFAGLSECYFAFCITDEQIRTLDEFGQIPLRELPFADPPPGYQIERPQGEISEEFWGIPGVEIPSTFGSVVLGIFGALALFSLMIGINDMRKRHGFWNDDSSVEKTPNEI